MPAGEAVPSYWKAYVHYDLQISLRGLLIWGCALLCVAHFLGAGLLLSRWTKTNPHSQVRYVDLVLPWRWDELDRLRAAGWAQESRQALERGEFWKGLTLARLALARDPEDDANRERIARMLLAIRMAPQARQTLTEGLSRGYLSRSALELTFQLAKEADKPGLWLELVHQARQRFEALPEAERTANEARWLDEQLIHALLASNRLTEAVALVADRYSENDVLRRELEVLGRLQQGDHAGALVASRAWTAMRPDSREAWRLRIRTAREARAWAEMDEGLAELRRLWPLEVDVWLYAIVQNRLADRDAEAAEWFRDILLRFGSEASLAGPLALVLSEAGMETELSQFEADLSERGWSLAPVWSARLHEAVGRRSWTDVLLWVRRLREVGEQAAAPGDGERRFLDLMERLARACLEDVAGAQSDLVEELSRRAGALKMYELALTALLESGRFETAARVLTLAEGPYPESVRLARLRLQIEGELKVRRPEEPSVANVQAPVSLDVLRLRLEELDEQGATEEALALISLARRAGGAWATASSAALEDLELPLQVRAGDILTAQLLVRRVLGRSSELTADQVLHLARLAWEQERFDMALLLVRELVRARPEHDDGLRQLEAWLPRD